MNKIFSTLIIAASSLLIVGCGNNPQNGGEIATVNQYEETAFEPSAGLTKSSADDRLVIKLVVNDTYGKQTACACIGDLACREYDELQKVLSEKYNIDLQLTYLIEEFYIKDSLLTQRYDGALCKPWFAYRLMPENNFDFKRIADLLDPDNNQWLTGLFIVKKDSPAQEVKDITGKILVTGQEDSFEKYHSPMAMLNKDGITPSSIINRSGCIESIGTLLDNVSEVAIISSYALTASCAVDIASPDDFRVIGETEKLPLCSIVLDMNKVGEADALRLQSALLEISGENVPEGIVSKGFVLPAKWQPAPIK